MVLAEKKSQMYSTQTGKNSNLRDIRHMLDRQHRQGQDATQHVHNVLNGIQEPTWEMSKETQVELLQKAFDILDNLFHDWGSERADEMREQIAKDKELAKCMT